MDTEDNLTTQWIADKLQGESQFQIVNHLIKLAHQKVRAGQGDEFGTELQNIALEVIQDVAEGMEYGSEEEEEEEWNETIQSEPEALPV